MDMKIPFTASYLFYALTMLLLGFGGGGLFHWALYDMVKETPLADSGLFVFASSAYRFNIWRTVPGYAIPERSFLELRGLYITCFAAGIVFFVVYKGTRLYIEKKAKEKSKK
jgi:tetrahydromethanopterin S-methyltransferase subunit D